MKSGIYTIFCTETNKYYVGQSLNVENRLKEHLRKLKNNNHINTSLQEDFNLYGEDSFILKKIKDVEKQFLNVMEGYYIDYYDSLKYGYNLQNINERIRSQDRQKIIMERATREFEQCDSVNIKLNRGDVVGYTLLFHLFNMSQGYYRPSIDYGKWSEYMLDILKSNIEAFNDILTKLMARLHIEIINQLSCKFKHVLITDLMVIPSNKSEFIPGINKLTILVEYRTFKDEDFKNKTMTVNVV